MPTRLVNRALAALLAAAVSAPGALAQAADPNLPTVAVLDFTGFLMGEGGNSAPLGKAVSAMLITELTGQPGLRVVERFELQDLIQEQKLALSGLVDENQAVEIGRLVGAQYMVYGQVSGVMGTLRMDMRAVDVETSEILEVMKLTGKTEELLDIVVQMADDFADQLDLAPPSDRPDVASVPPMATIEFSRGLDFEDKDDVPTAIEHYRKALEIFPGHEGARRALERLESGGVN